MLMMLAFPVLRKCGMQYLPVKKSDFKLVSITESQSFSVIDSTVPWGMMPALLTRMSSRLYFLIAASVIFLTLVAEDTSVLTKNALPPFLTISAATFLPLSERVAITTCAPSRANRSAIAFPMPFPAPVTMATFPRSCIFGC